MPLRTNTRLASALVVVAAALAGCGDDAARPARETDAATRAAPQRPAPAPPTAPADVAPPSAGRCRLSGTVARDGRAVDADIALRVAKPSGRRDDGRFWFADELDAPAPARPTASARARDGSFELTELAPRAYRVAATTEDGAVAECRVDFAADGESREIVLRFAPRAPGHKLRGHVVGPDGGPFRGFVAAGEIDETSRQPDVDETAWRETAADGSFELTVESSRRAVVAALVPGHLRAVGPEVLLPTDDEYVLDLSKTLAKVRVHVFDEVSGAPVPNADVGVYSQNLIVLATERTGPDGVCTLAANATQRALYVSAPGYPAVDELEFGPGETAIEIPLRAGPSVRARVVRADDGQPVAGAAVYVRRFGDRGVGDGPPPVRTAPEGIAEVAGLAPGGVLVFAHDERWISEGLELGRLHGRSNEMNNRFPRRRPDWLPPSGRLDVEIRVVPAGVVQGRVVRADGTPVAGAAVRAYPQSLVPYLGGLEEARNVATDADGRFLLSGLFPAARYGLRATSSHEPGTAAGSVDVRSPGEVVLRFEAACWIDVAVVDETSGLGVAEANVTCAKADDPSRRGFQLRDDTVAATTDSEGRARVGPVAAGDYDLVASSATHERCPPQRATATAGDSARLTLRLARGTTVRGRAVLPDGTAPESGAVSAEPDRGEGRRNRRWSEPEQTTPLAPDGSFELTGLAKGSHTLVATARRGATHFEGRAIAESDGVPTELRLVPTQDRTEPASPERPTFLVRVVGPDGRPVGKASIHAEWTEDGLTQSTSFSVDRGEARLPLAVRGTSVTVSGAASLNGIRLDAETLEATIPADAADGHELRLAPGAVVSGSVTDEMGRPVAGVLMSVLRPRDGPFERFSAGGGATGTDGRFEIRGLGAADYDLVASVPEDFEPPAEVRVHGGQQDVRVTAVHGMRPVVVVLDDAEKPIVGAEVTVKAGDSFFDPDSFTSETGADGRATLPALSREKEYELHVSPPNWSEIQPHSAPWTRAAETVVRLTRLLAIGGRVVDPNGAPVAGVDVWYRPAGSKDERESWGRRSWNHVRTDASGRFVVDGLEPGDVDLVAGNYGVKSGRGNGGWYWDIVDEETQAAASVAAIRKTAGTSDVELRLAATDMVRVRFAGLPGPLTPDEIPALGPTGNDGGRPALATKDPSVVLFTGLAPGRDYELRARFPRLGVVGHATIRAGADTSVTLEPGTALVGRFAVPDGTTVEELSVSYSIGDWRIEATATGDGNFVIPCLPRVEGDVTAWRYGAGARWIGTVRGTPGTRVEATLTEEK